jgi:hypothetical protein
MNFFVPWKKEKKRRHVFKKEKNNCSCVGVSFSEMPAFCTPKDMH